MERHEIERQKAIERLTDRNKEILLIICDYMDVQGEILELSSRHPPAIRTLCDLSGVTSTGAMSHHMKVLKLCGYIVGGEIIREEINELYRRDIRQILSGPYAVTKSGYDAAMRFAKERE